MVEDPDGVPGAHNRISPESLGEAQGIRCVEDKIVPSLRRATASAHLPWLGG